MSIEALNWALNDAPIPTIPSPGGLTPPNSSSVAFVLVSLANHAGPDGRNAFPSVERITRYTQLSERTVRRCLDFLHDHEVIRDGDRAVVAAYIRRADRRPQSFDLAMERTRDTEPAAEPAATPTEAPKNDSDQQKQNGVSPCHPVNEAVDNSPVDNSERGVTVTPRGIERGVTVTERGVTVTERGVTVTPEPSLTVREPSFLPTREELVDNSAVDDREEGRQERPSGGEEQPPAADAGHERARVFLDEMHPTWRHRAAPQIAAEVISAVASAQDRGWSVPALTDELSRSLGGVECVAAVWRSRLAALGDPPADTPDTAPGRDLPDCHECGARTGDPLNARLVTRTNTNRKTVAEWCSCAVGVQSRTA